MQQPNLASPGVAGALSPTPAIQSPGQRDPSRRPYLYVGQLSQQVSESLLGEVFGSVGSVVSTKIVADQRTMQQGVFNYGFVEYADLLAAEMALQTLNGRNLFDSEIRVDWATGGHSNNQSGGTSLANSNGVSNAVWPVGGTSNGGSTGAQDGNKENVSSHSHVFVGDLSPEIKDLSLRQAFQSFPSISEARVVAFRDKSDAEQAIATMNGEWLGSRTIRVNWANQRSQAPPPHQQHQQQHQQQSPGMMQNRSIALMSNLGGMGAIAMGPTSMPPTGGAASGTPITYEQAMAGSPPHNTTVYVGNIPPFATVSLLLPRERGREGEREREGEVEEGEEVPL
jgi:nucleolysin TIA-1/TIAR